MEAHVDPSETESKPVGKDDLQTLPLAEVEKKLGSSPDGLTQVEAQKRLTQYGPNEIAEKKTNEILKFLSYFWGPIPWMIEAAVILSAAARHWPDFGIILLLLLANAMVGFWEEHQAGNAIAALKATLAIKARVKRDGKWVNPAARELVPGDAIRLRLGDIVPADARLLDGDEISVDQSALTGESMPATRKSGDAVFSGSIVRRGEIDALVYATGGKTYFGKTAELVETAVTVSHFQKAVLKIGNYLIILALILVAVIIGLGIYRGEPILTVLQFALVLTVAAIPVAMPTVLSVTMAVGARLLARKQAIVSKLVAIEELAGVDVLCADKTGTLTQNKLTLGEPFCLDAITADDLILAGALASQAANNDTIDLAVLGGLKDKQALKPYQVTHFQPFDPVHKRTEATVKGADGKTFKVTKGAPQVILALSANAAAVKSAVDKAVDDFAARGFRALGVARADGDGEWRLLGVLPLFDPPREDAKATVATAAEMGVKIKMVTGDALAIAREMAKTLGMGANILDANTLGDAKSEETAAVAKTIEDADGFAQVFPEHKFHIVDVLQKHGHIVGMTGDGVNDAPALKKADCGIAVSGATDAARAAASIVLLTPGLSVIIEAIKESRRIFQRMNSYAIYRIAETLRVLLFMTLAIVVFKFYPLTAIMIVMLALLNDGAILSIAYDNVIYRNKPEAWDMRTVLGIATVLGVVGVISAFGLFYLGDRVFHLDRAHIQTMMYLILSVAGHLTIFLTRTRGPFWSIRPARILLAGGCRHAGSGDPDLRLRVPRHAARVGLGGLGLGLRAVVVPRERSREADRVLGPRSDRSQIRAECATRMRLRSRKSRRSPTPGRRRPPLPSKPPANAGDARANGHYLRLRGALDRGSCDWGAGAPGSHCRLAGDARRLLETYEASCAAEDRARQAEEKAVRERERVGEAKAVSGKAVDDIMQWVRASQSYEQRQWLASSPSFSLLALTSQKTS